MTALIDGVEDALAAAGEAGIGFLALRLAAGRCALATAWALLILSSREDALRLPNGRWCHAFYC